MDTMQYAWSMRSIFANSCRKGQHRAWFKSGLKVEGGEKGERGGTGRTKEEREGGRKKRMVGREERDGGMEEEVENKGEYRGG